MNYVHTLSWNLPKLVEETTKSIYKLNDKKEFVHIIVDLGFPLMKDEIPRDLVRSKMLNSQTLMDIATRYGSLYFETENIGVSQNWSSVYNFIDEDYGFREEDCLICADPDERPKTKGWIKALGDVLRSDEKYGWVCLAMEEYFDILNKNNTIEKEVNGHKIWGVIGNLNWAQGGFSGKFLLEEGGIPYLEEMPIYGGIEHASLVVMKELGYKWCTLPEYIVEHNDYEKGSQGHSRLLREWKNDIIFNLDKQITFEEWLEKY